MTREYSSYDLSVAMLTIRNIEDSFMVFIFCSFCSLSSSQELKLRCAEHAPMSTSKISTLISFSGAIVRIKRPQRYTGSYRHNGVPARECRPEGVHRSEGYIGERVYISRGSV